eukprot:jgi/Mesvir1/11776/Mv00143-RA.1
MASACAHFTMSISGTGARSPVHANAYCARKAPVRAVNVATSQFLNTGAFTRKALSSCESRVWRATARKAPLRIVAVDANVNGDSEKSNRQFVPNEDFYKVEAIVRPWRLNYVTEALRKEGIKGLTVSEVRGHGAQAGRTERYMGSEFGESQFVQKVRIEVVVIADQVEVVIDTIQRSAWTGEIGDGKIFVYPISEVVRVRTGERGWAAEQMQGGRNDMLRNMKMQEASLSGLKAQQGENESVA